MEELPEHTPLRILMTTDTVGGVWSYSVELCRALLPYGIQFYLITTGAPLQPAQKSEIETLQNVAVYETHFLLEWMEHPWESIGAAGGWLLQLEEELRPDVIHLNEYSYGSLSWKAPVIMVAHSDVFSWFHAVKGESPTADWNEYFISVSKGLQGADCLIAPSRWMMEKVRKIYNITVPGRVINNGRSSTTFFPAQKQPFIFSMGRIWDEAKNIKLLMDAAPHIQYPIRLAGDNHFANNKEETEAANIAYLGKLSTAEVAMQLAAAAVYVLPAKYEPFGLSVLEAALSGCVLVLGYIDPLREIWGNSAVYVDTANAHALADTINSLMESDTLRQHYAQAAMRRAEKYTTTAMANAYMDVYRKMALSPALLRMEKGAST